jgi:hypothetical protein
MPVKPRRIQPRDVAIEIQRVGKPQLVPEEPRESVEIHRLVRDRKDRPLPSSLTPTPLRT